MKMHVVQIGVGHKRNSFPLLTGNHLLGDSNLEESVFERPLVLRSSPPTPLLRFSVVVLCRRRRIWYKSELNMYEEKVREGGGIQR